MRSDVVVPFLLFCALAGGCGGSPQVAPTSPAAAPATPLENGIYFVKGEVPVMSEKPPPAGPSERVLRFDPTKYDSLSREAARFVRVSADERLSLVAGEPQLEATDDGKQLLWLQLDEGTAKGIEGFARSHEGGKVAVVVANEIVGVHKVREIEKLGHLRLAKCTEKGCDTIKSKLGH